MAVLGACLTKDVTGLLQRWSSGKREAFDELIPLVHAELSRLAKSLLRHERRDHTLQPAALTNEAYLRLVRQGNVHWHSRAHFFAVAARTMRRILVDHARRRKAAKRGGDCEVDPLDDVAVSDTNESLDLLKIDDALDRLATIDVRQSQVVELRYFSGLTIRETAVVLGVSQGTVKTDWNVAKLWLYRELQGS